MTEPEPPKYEVGYGKPPQATRYRPGQSGNPKGRPKGVRNYATVLADELQARVTVKENGRRHTITKLEAAAKQLANKAASGDPKAIALLLREARTQESLLPAAAGSDALSAAEDASVMASILARLRGGNAMEVQPSQGQEATE